MAGAGQAGVAGVSEAMGYCNGRCTLIFVCGMQLVSAPVLRLPPRRASGPAGRGCARGPQGVRVGGKSEGKGDTCVVHMGDDSGGRTVWYRGEPSTPRLVLSPRRQFGGCGLNLSLIYLSQARLAVVPFYALHSYDCLNVIVTCRLLYR